MERKLAILDRDGIVNREIGEYVFQERQFEYVEGFWEFIDRLVQKGYVFAIATNQGGIAKGLYSRKDFEKLMQRVEEDFLKHKAHLTGIYFAPGHDSISQTLSRKPKSLMLEKAIAVAGVKPEYSFFVGDSIRDVKAAHKAGIRGFCVPSNTNLNDFFDDHQF